MSEHAATMLHVERVERANAAGDVQHGGGLFGGRSRGALNRAGVPAGAIDGEVDDSSSVSGHGPSLRRGRDRPGQGPKGPDRHQEHAASSAPPAAMLAQRT